MCCLFQWECFENNLFLVSILFLVILVVCIYYFCYNDVNYFFFFYTYIYPRKLLFILRFSSIFSNLSYHSYVLCGSYIILILLMWETFHVNIPSSHLSLMLCYGVSHTLLLYFFYWYFLQIFSEFCLIIMPVLFHRSTLSYIVIHS